MNVHAVTTVDGRDRKRLERLARYLLRPAFALDAVHRLPDGRVRLDLPRKGRFIDLTPEQFLAKLCALPLIVPSSEPCTAAPLQLPLFDFEGKPLSPSDLDEHTAASTMPARSWPCLLARVFSIDIEACPCGGRLKLLQVVVDLDYIAAHLHGARAPPRPTDPGQLSLLPA